MIHGLFWTIAWPWINLGANCIPVAPGDKKPTMAGWGRRGEMAERWCGVNAPLHSRDSPKLPPEAYGEMVARHGHLNALIFPASIDATVVDVDNLDRLEDVINACGDTPFRTFSGRVGGGMHLWYAGASKSQVGVTPGVDVKSTGGYVLAPGSIHPKTGEPYTASPELAAALAIGRLVLPRPREGWRARLSSMSTVVTEISMAEIRSLVDHFRRRRETENARRFDLLARGDEWAKPGERDNVLFAMLAVLAAKYPHASAESVAKLFEPSAAVMESVDTDNPVQIPIVEAVATKWERLCADREVLDEQATVRQLRRRREAWTWVGERNREDPAHVGDLPIVVYHGKSYFTRVGDLWHGPVSRDWYTPAVLDTLRGLYGLELADMGGLLAAWGTAAAELSSSLTVRRTTYDPISGEVVIAAAPIRADLTSLRSPAAETMIAELAGPWAGHLTWWLAGLLRTDVPCRALVLSGPKETAKSAFLAGLGRLWRDGASKMRSVLGRRFNAAATESWLCVADDDENGPTESGEAMAAFLRGAVSDRMQSIERKHHEIAKLRGCMRYAVATNDADNLIRGAVSYKLNDESLDAFGDRIMHVPVPASARGWWTRRGVDLSELVEGDGLARHILWLHGLGLGSGDRFFVPAADTQLARMAVVSSGLRGEILCQIATALRAPVRPTWMRVSCAGVEVHGPELRAVWMDRPPGTTDRLVGLALSALGTRKKGEDDIVRYVIPRELVIWYAEKCGL